MDVQLFSNPKVQIPKKIKDLFTTLRKKALFSNGNWLVRSYTNLPKSYFEENKTKYWNV